MGDVLKSNGPEHPNHYADIDAPLGPDGKNWRDICLSDGKKISVEAWQEFYTRMAATATDPDIAAQYAEPLKQGLLPFRRIPNADLMGFARCGHWVQVERKADFERHVISFVS